MLLALPEISVTFAKQLKMKSGITLASSRAHRVLVLLTRKSTRLLHEVRKHASSCVSDLMKLIAANGSVFEVAMAERK